MFLFITVWYQYSSFSLSCQTLFTYEELSHTSESTRSTVLAQLSRQLGARTWDDPRHSFSCCTTSRTDPCLLFLHHCNNIALRLSTEMLVKSLLSHASRGWTWKEVPMWAWIGLSMGFCHLQIERNQCPFLGSEHSFSTPWYNWHPFLLGH